MNGSPRQPLSRQDKNIWRIIDKVLRFFRRSHGARLAKIAKDALDGLPHEKFLRLVGWFHTMVPAALKQKDAKGKYLDPTVREFENIRVMIEQKCQQGDLRFQRDEMGDHVHNLNLVLGKLVTAEALEIALPPLRDDYRMRVTPETYAAYTGSPVYKALAGCHRPADAATKLRLLQADFIQLVNEIRKLTLLEYHIEETRTYLIKKLRRTLYKLLITPAAIVLLFLLARITTPLESSSTLFHVLVLATLLSLAAIAGAVGSFISALLRIAAVPESNEVGRSVVALRYSESIRLAPVTGFIFAVLLSFIFGGQLVNGILFPKTDQIARWPDLLFSAPDLAKWMVWAFIVGFAERLMPDMIDRLVVKAGKTAQPAPASSAANGARPHGPEHSVNGANGNIPAAPVRPIVRKRRRARVHTV
jgi:hypothetical protein